MIRQLAIDFSDNDFGTTFQVVLETYFQRFRYYSYDPKNENPTKEEICRDLNLLLYPMYKVFQNRFEYGDDKEHMIRYLTIEPKDVYINEEVKEYMETCQHKFNSSFFLVQESFYGSDETEFFRI